MKRLLLIFPALFTLVALGQNSNMLFSKEHLLADYDTLHAWIKSVHPKLYANADSAVTERAWKVRRVTINRPMSQWEFHKAVAPLVHQYNDAHTYVEVNFQEASFEKFRKDSGLFFPLAVKLFGDSLIVLHDTSSVIEAGSLITRINRKPVTALLRDVRSLVSGDNLQNRNANFSRLFAYLYWLAYKKDGSYEIEYLAPGNRKKKVLLEGLLVDDYFKRIFPTPFWIMKIHPEENLAVIECSNYSGNLDRIRQKLDSFFTVIKQQNIRHVALDLRRNGGGNSYIGNIFLSYITTAPFAAVQSKSYRNSWALQNFPETDFRKKDLEAFRTTAQSSNGYLTTTYTTSSGDAVAKPELLFKGKFYLLTSSRTYSSAHMTALQVKCAKLGTIIGQPTGEMVDLTGEIKDFALPNTKLPVWIPLAMYKAACPLEAKIGVQPDCYVQPTVADVIQGRDAEVDYLKHLIRTAK